MPLISIGNGHLIAWEIVFGFSNTKKPPMVVEYNYS